MSSARVSRQAGAALAIFLSLAPPIFAAPVCGAGDTDDRLLPLPPSLVEPTKQIFGLAMPDDLVTRTTLMRCTNGAVMVCNEGANLPCGKANMSQVSPGASAYCKENPKSTMVPAYATGHGTIYTWHCDAGQARAGKPIQNVDPRGFITQFWKRLPDGN
jgi:hypothetical protein